MLILSKTQNHLGNDIVLDLVGSAINGGLAHVEIARRGAVRIIGADRVLVVAFAKAAEIGRAIMADCFQCEFGDALSEYFSVEEGVV